MEKTLKPSDVEQPKHLMNVAPEVRGELISELPEKDRGPVLESLVEYAMTSGLTDVVQIRRWLGLMKYPTPTIKAAKKRVMVRWMDETADVYVYARAQRATQIYRAWEEVRNIEELYKGAVSTADKVKVKKLLLEWMQYISRLSFVDKMVEASEPDLQIVVNSGVVKEEVVEIGGVKNGTD